MSDDTSIPPLGLICKSIYLNLTFFLHIPCQYFDCYLDALNFYSLTYLVNFIFLISSYLVNIFVSFRCSQFPLNALWFPFAHTQKRSHINIYQENYANIGIIRYW